MTSITSRSALSGQLVRFAIVGAASTVLNLVLFALLKQWMSNQPANALALVICTILNTTANRWFTFDAGNQGGHLAVQLRSLALLALTWSATAAALWLLERVHPGASTTIATATVAIGNAVATVIRFVFLRKWFAPVDPVA